MLYFRPGFSTLCFTFGLFFSLCVALFDWVFIMYCTYCTHFVLYFQLGFSTCVVLSAGFNNALYPRPGFSTLFCTFSLGLIPCDVLSTGIVCFSAYV